MLPNQSTQLAADRVGNYQHTAPEGLKYFPFDPRPEEVNIESIAHHLATECRFQGGVLHPSDPDRIFYCVAEHSVYVMRYVIEVLQRPEYALEALLHDSSEFAIGDLIRPLKYSSEFRKPFQTVESLNEIVHAQAFNLIYPYPKEIKIADEAVCAAEMAQIVPQHPDDEWESDQLLDDSKIAPYEIRMLDPIQARNEFLDAFYSVTAARKTYRSIADRFVL